MELASTSVWVTHKSVVSGSFRESVRVGKVLVSALELVTRDISTSDTREERVRVEVVELVFAPGWETNETVVSGLSGESVRIGTTGLVSAPELVSRDVTSPGKLGETVEVVVDELLCTPGWVIHGSVVSDSSVELVRVGVNILVSAPGLITSEVTIPGILGETVRVGRVKLTFSPELVAIGSVLSDLLWETFRVALETVGLTCIGWVTLEVVASGSPKETAGVGTAKLVSAQELRTSVGVVSDSLLNIDEVVLENAVLVSAPGLVAKAAVISRTSGETSGVVMIIPVVLVLAVLVDVLRRVRIPKVGVETLVVKISVVVVSGLSIPPVGSPVNCGLDTRFRHNNYHLLD